MRMFFELLRGLWPLFVILAATLVYADGVLYDAGLPYKLIEAGKVR